MRARPCFELVIYVMLKLNSSFGVFLLNMLKWALMRFAEVAGGTIVIDKIMGSL